MNSKDKIRFSKIVGALAVSLLFLVLCIPAYASSEKINVNTASAGELDRLPGIGPSKARSIVNHRSENGAFRTVAELRKVRGIGPRILEKIRPYVHVGDGSVERGTATARPQNSVNINTGDAITLRQLRGIGKVSSNRIVAYREMHGPFLRVDDLARVKGIGPKTVANFRDRITLGIDINVANESAFKAFGFANAKQISEYRRDRGAFRNADDLLKVPGADESFINRVKPLLR